MITVIFKTVGLLKASLSKKKEDQIILFERYVEPAIRYLNLVHQNYINNFLGYIISIETQRTKDLSDHPVLQLIHEDSISSGIEREKLFPFYNKEDNDLLKRFVNTIGKYFLNLSQCLSDKMDDEAKSLYLMPNLSGYELYMDIENSLKEEWLPEADRKDNAVKKIQDRIHLLQKGYREVMENYNQIKRELLV